MKRRTLLHVGVGAALTRPLLAAFRKDNLDAASAVLAKATSDGQVGAAALCVRHGKNEFVKAFGKAKNADAMFLLGSISKPMSVTALLTLMDQGKFGLDDPVKKFLPEFTGGS